MTDIDGFTNFAGMVAIGCNFDFHLYGLIFLYVAGKVGATTLGSRLTTYLLPNSILSHSSVFRCLCLWKFNNKFRTYCYAC